MTPRTFLTGQPPHLPTLEPLYLKILDWNKRQLNCIQQPNQPLEFLCSGCSRAESKQTGLGGRHVKRQKQRKRKRRKRDSWSQTACQKKERSPATNATFLQVRQSDASGNSSFLPGLKEALLTHFLSLVSISPTALATSPAKPRN